ncbi:MULTISPECIES: hypothetical protein [unclassified Sphingopyxis]|jgi:hypothetical protein|nr:MULTISPECIES: hypothetical protein [unclassified Sphingopyxis]
MLQIALHAAAPSALDITPHPGGSNSNGRPLPTLSREELRRLIAEMID